MGTAAVSATEERLRVEHLAVSYTAEEILRDISLTVSTGEIVAIIGRSGCGKSTLLRALCGLQGADKGNVWLDSQKIIGGGVLLFEGWEVRRHIMMVAQGPSLLPHLTALENISVGLRRVRNKSKREAVERSRDIARELGLERVLNSYPEELSGGQLQRVQLARAVVLEPRVLLLDEVTSALDPETIQEVVNSLRRMRRLAAEQGQSILLVTHLLQFAFEFADRVIFVHNGIVHEEGRADVFRLKASQDETRKFIASVL